MKKRIVGLFIAIFLMFTTNVKANSINSIDMDIYIGNDGTAHVTENWNASLSNGTEGYKPYYNLGASEITNFKVSENGNYYNTLDSWNVDASFNEKSYKNGFHYISNGVELCWGISTYGNHVYKLEYDITNFVSITSDKYQMAYSTLIPYDLSSKPSDVKINIHSDQAYADTLPVWGYGNYGGLAYVSDGTIKMDSQGTLESNEYMTILIQFPENTFNLTNQLDNDFNYYLEMANKGAEVYVDNSNNSDNSYSDDNLLLILLSIIFPLSILAIVILSSIKSVHYNDIINLKKVGKNVPMFRDIPTKDMFKAYFISNKLSLTNRDSDFFGVMLLKWLKEGKITIKKIEKEGVFKDKEETVIEFKEEELTFLDFREKDLYNILYRASKNGILESKEFEKWCRKNYSEILDWFEFARSSERNILYKNGELEDVVVTKMKIFKSVKTSATYKLIEEALQIEGLKKFLNEFGDIGSKEAIEVHLWDEYLMYAQLFGIAKKVAEQFKKLYPDITNIANQNGDSMLCSYDFDTFIFINNFSTRSMSSVTSARSAAESYSSGGGGFSSGGGGGGSFGGGGGGGGFR